MESAANFLNPGIYARLCTLIYERSGISLGTGKHDLLAARVSTRMSQVGLAKPSQYMTLLEGAGQEQELVHLVDAITTNFTSFFREQRHFDILCQWVSKNLILGSSKLRVWSAACSSGEEPYTLAMTLLNTIGHRRVDLKVLATDISTQVLATARSATYPLKQLEGIPVDMRARYCRSNHEERTFTIAEEARDVVLFRRLNLSTPPYPLRGPLDVIFCRNVMIYFDEEVRQRLVSAFERLLRPGGLLFIGHSESITSLSSRFRTIVPSVYVNEANRKTQRAS